MGQLTGKTAIISGGVSFGSMGYRLAANYARAGADLILSSCNMGMLLNVKVELEKLYGIRVLPVQADSGTDDENAASVTFADKGLNSFWENSFL